VLLAIERAVATIRSSDPDEMPCHSAGTSAPGHGRLKTPGRRRSSGGRAPRLVTRGYAACVAGSTGSTWTGHRSPACWPALKSTSDYDDPADFFN